MTPRKATKRLNQKTPKEKRIRVRIKNKSCHLCNHKTDSASKLETHVNAVHYGIKDFKCPLCDHMASKQSNINAHVKAVHYGIKDLKCPLCDHIASEQSNINAHVKAVHYGIKDFQCPLCDQTASTQSKINAHVKAVHYGIKDFKCPLCDYIASKQSNIDRHVNASHYGIKDYHCHLCEYAASTKQARDRHINASHYGIKDFHCHLCEHAASTKESLDVHIRAVHGMNPVNCFLCDYIAPHDNQLLIHISKFHFHQGSRQCPRCDYFDVYGSSLKNHLEAVHDDYSMSLPGAKSNVGADLVEQPAQVAPHPPVILGFADKVMKNCSPLLVNLRREKCKLPNQKMLDRYDSFPYTASEIRENEHSWWSHELEIRERSDEMLETAGNRFYTVIMLDSRKVSSLLCCSLEDEDAAFKMYKASVIHARAGKGQATNLLLHALQEYGLLVRNPNMLPLTETSAAVLDCWSSGSPVIILELFTDSNWTEAVARESCLLAALGIPDRVKKMNSESNKDLTSSWTDQKKIQCGSLIFLHGFLQFVDEKPKGFRVTDLNLEPHLLAEAENLVEHYKRAKTVSSQQEEPFLVSPAAVGRDAFPDGLSLKLQEMVKADYNQRDRQGSRSDYNSDNDFKDDDIYQHSTKRKGAKGKALSLIDGLAIVERPRSRRTGKRQIAALASTEATNGPNHLPKLARLSNGDSDEGRIITKLKRVGDRWSVFPEN